MTSGTLQLLWGIGLGLVFLGLLLDLVTGNSEYAILVVNGSVLSMWWVALRGIELRSQRFLRSRPKIMLSLFVTTVGSVAVSLGIAMSAPTGGVPSNLTFSLSGLLVVLIGIAMYILSLALTKPSTGLAP